jgi:Ca-activated chloride channel homolog
VNVPVIVTDERGGYLEGLAKRDFALYDDGREQPVALFSSSQEVVNVALLLDTSKSTVTVLNKIKQAARRFIRRLRPGDRVLVIAFDHDIRVLSPATDDLREAEKAVRETAPGKYVGTRLRDAVLEVTAKRFKTLAGRKAIVLLTDGQDYGSEVSRDDLLVSVATSGTLIYSIFYPVDLRALARKLFGVDLPRPRRMPSGGQSDAPWLGRERDAERFLGQLSELSGGRLLPGRISDLDRSFTQIVDELRYQYFLAFYPDRSRLDGNVHELTIKVARPGVSVRARHSYQVLGAGPR